MAATKERTYWEKLLDPRWQRKRLEIFERDGFMCVMCGASGKELHVHHKYYRYGFDPWEYGDDTLTTVCCECHDTADCLRLDLGLVVARLSIRSQRRLFYLVANLNAREDTADAILDIILQRFDELDRDAEDACRLGNDTES